MTTYGKNLLAWAWTMGIGLALIAGAIYISNWFVILFFAWILCASPFLKMIRCAACGESINLQRTSVLGLPYNAGPFRKYCLNCGSNLENQICH
jgi:hypothetical protein